MEGPSPTLHLAKAAGRGRIHRAHPSTLMATNAESRKPRYDSLWTPLPSKIRRWPVGSPAGESSGGDEYPMTSPVAPSRRRVGPCGCGWRPVRAAPAARGRAVVGPPSGCRYLHVGLAVTPPGAPGGPSSWLASSRATFEEPYVGHLVPRHGGSQRRGRLRGSPTWGTGYPDMEHLGARARGPGWARWGTWEGEPGHSVGRAEVKLTSRWGAEGVQVGRRGDPREGPQRPPRGPRRPVWRSQPATGGQGEPSHAVGEGEPGQQGPRARV